MHSSIGFYEKFYASVYKHVFALEDPYDGAHKVEDTLMAKTSGTLFPGLFGLGSENDKRACSKAGAKSLKSDDPDFCFANLRAVLAVHIRQQGQFLELSTKDILGVMPPDTDGVFISTERPNRDAIHLIVRELREYKNSPPLKVWTSGDT